MLKRLSFIFILILSLASCKTVKNHIPLQANFEEFTGEAPELYFQNQFRAWAYVVSVYDGDSVTILFSTGVNSYQIWKTRLSDIDAPEIRGKERELGLATKKWLAGQVLNRWILVDFEKGHQLDKYGRLLVTLQLPNKENIEAPLNLNQEMVRLGLAKEYLKKSDENEKSN